MSRTPATHKQPDIARAIRAARQAGADGVELRKDGTIHILLNRKKAEPEVQEKEVVL
jgi:hypothetical protein